MRRKGPQNNQLRNGVASLFLLLLSLDRRVISVVSILSIPEMLEYHLIPYERQY
jgi:hypothetical protein